jgi:SHS2 domain-containing protein
MAASLETLSHTADTGIEVRADTLGELFEWAARGMFGLMFDLGGLVPERDLDVDVQAPSLPDLLVDTLSELLYRSEADDALPCAFAVEEASATRARMRVGLTTAGRSLHGPPVKAVTYHALVVEQTPDGRWLARVVFDV